MGESVNITQILQKVSTSGSIFKCQIVRIFVTTHIRITQTNLTKIQNIFVFHQLRKNKTTTYGRIEIGTIIDR